MSPSALGGMSPWLESVASKKALTCVPSGTVKKPGGWTPRFMDSFPGSEGCYTGVAPAGQRPTSSRYRQGSLQVDIVPAFFYRPVLGTSRRRLRLAADRWSYTSRRIEGAWRTHAPTKRRESPQPLTTFFFHVSLVEQVSADNERSWKPQKMPTFALSRRQHGFESRWGYKIKPPLTRSNASYSWRHQPQHELRERQGSETAAAAPTSSPLSRSGSLVGFVRPLHSPSGRAATGQLRSGPSGRCPALSRHSARRILTPTFSGPAERSARRMSLWGSTAIPNRCAQLTKGDSPNKKGAGYEPDC